jgi:ABC-type nitrate/sulfonate/bicarbonate transport system substrate-binding protein
MNREISRSLVFSFSTTLLVSALFLSGAAVMAADKQITIGYPGLSPELFPIFVAEKKGFFRNVGLRPALTLMASGVTTTALASREVDYTTNGSALLTGAQQRLGMRVVMGIANRNLFTLVAAPDIKSTKELKGKTIGVNAFGGTQALSTENYLRRIGLEPGKDVQLLAFGGSTARMAALEKKLIQATLLPPPANVLAERKGYRILIRGDEMSNVPHALFGTHLDKIRTDRDEIVNVITAILSGIRFIQKQAKEAIPLLAEWAKIEAAPAQRVYDLVVEGYPQDGQLVEDGILALTAMIQKAGNLKSTGPVLISDLVDSGPLKEAVDRLASR